MQEAPLTPTAGHDDSSHQEQDLIIPAAEDMERAKQAHVLSLRTEIAMLTATHQELLDAQTEGNDTGELRAKLIEITGALNSALTEAFEAGITIQSITGSNPESK